MNNWTTIHKTAIVEADDFQDKYNRNGLDMLFYWKAKFPKFKITLYTIPNRTSKEMLHLLQPHIEEGWIELAVHGWDHESNYECYSWDYEKTKALMERVDAFQYEGGKEYGLYNYYTKNFKAPGWTITPDLNGYPASENALILKDKQGVYKALTDMGFVICDRHYNKPRRPTEDNIICIDCNPQIVHMHTWNMETGDKNGQNGFYQVEELHGVPWDQNTEFFTMKEAWQNQLYLPCK